MSEGFQWVRTHEDLNILRILHGVYAAALHSSAMDHKAALLALILVSSSLAGCTGDPDAGGGDEFDADALQDLIDENLQDFINNTSVTVYQEIHHHYHNNTTIDNTDNSVSNINGSGTGSGSVVQVFRTVWDPEGQYERTDFGARNVIVDGIVQVPIPSGWESYNSTFIYTQNGITFALNMTCEELVNAYLRVESGDWRYWVLDAYGGSTSQANSVGNSIYWSLNDLVNVVDGGYCFNNDPGGTEYEYNYITLFEISIDEGEAIEFLSLPSIHNMTIDCDDGFSGTTTNSTFWQESDMVGGQSDCMVQGNAEIRTKYAYNSTPIANGSGPSLNPPPWYYANSWYVFYSFPASEYEYAGTTSDFLVYFRMHFVEVYDLDSE